MATKVPEKVFFNTLIKEIQDSAPEWSKKKAEDGREVLDTTEHNTALVIRALRRASRKAGYISLRFTLLTCKTEEDK